MPMKNPPHPGGLIRTGIIEALGLSVSKAAVILRVRRATLSDLLHAKAALTPWPRRGGTPTTSVSSDTSRLEPGGILSPATGKA